jgi:hypothetical protein
VWRNALFAAVRLGLMVVLGLVGLGAQAIVLSWVLPVVVWIVLGSLVLVVMTRAASLRARGGALPGWRPARDVPRPDVRGRARPALLYNVVTVIVTERFGSATGALFFMAWQAVHGRRQQRELLHEVAGRRRRPGARPGGRAGRGHAQAAAHDLPAAARARLPDRGARRWGSSSGPSTPRRPTCCACCCWASRCGWSC